MEGDILLDPLPLQTNHLYKTAYSIPTTLWKDPQIYLWEGLQDGLRVGLLILRTDWDYNHGIPSSTTFYHATPNL